MDKQYQTGYSGEYYVSNTSIVNGKKQQTRTWVPASCQNTQHNTVAHVIGNGESRKDFNLQHLAEVHGGLLANAMGQTYGCNMLYTDFKPDFLILTSSYVANLISPNMPCDVSNVYSTAAIVSKYDEKYNLLPFNMKLCAGAYAAYLACFHGHKTVYLLGFDGQPEETITNNMYTGSTGYPNADTPSSSVVIDSQLAHVMATYDDVEFVRVMPSKGYVIPESWKWLTNLRRISYNDYVRECDLGSALHYLKKQ